MWTCRARLRHRSGGRSEGKQSIGHLRGTGSMPVSRRRCSRTRRSSCGTSRRENLIGWRRRASRIGISRSRGRSGCWPGRGREGRHSDVSWWWSSLFTSPVTTTFAWTTARFCFSRQDLLSISVAMPLPNPSSKMIRLLLMLPKSDSRSPFLRLYFANPRCQAWTHAEH